MKQSSSDILELYMLSEVFRPHMIPTWYPVNESLDSWSWKLVGFFRHLRKFRQKTELPEVNAHQLDKMIHALQCPHIMYISHSSPWGRCVLVVIFRHSRKIPTGDEISRINAHQLYMMIFAWTIAHIISKHSSFLGMVGFKMVVMLIARINYYVTFVINVNNSLHAFSYSHCLTERQTVSITLLIH